MCLHRMCDARDGFSTKSRKGFAMSNKKVMAIYKAELPLEHEAEAADAMARHNILVMAGEHFPAAPPDADEPSELLVQRGYTKQDCMFGNTDAFVPDEPDVCMGFLCPAPSGACDGCPLANKEGAAASDGPLSWRTLLAPAADVLDPAEDYLTEPAVPEASAESACAETDMSEPLDVVAPSAPGEKTKVVYSRPKRKRA